MSGLRERIAEALAERYTSGVGYRNPEWDIEKPDGPDNEYYLTVPMDARITQSVMECFIAADGGRSLRTPTCLEIADVLIAAGVVHEEPAGIYGSEADR